MSDSTQPPFAAPGPATAVPTRPRSSSDSPSLQRSRSGKMQLDRNGAMPMPMPVAAPQRPLGAQPPPGEPTTAAGFGQMGMPRSPPKNKNTQHVPCKFFIYGQCQAGRTCPFSHDIESTTRPAQCKYFAKGSCKFGRKCALLHVTPDGTVVNRPQGYPPAAAPFPGPAGPPGAFPPQVGPPGLLAQGLERRMNGDATVETEGYPHGLRNGYEVAPMDMNYASISPQFGSPIQENRFGGSPPAKGFSVLDAPLPNSFDSNGISMAARNGPFAASVPSRFGVESPPSSLPRKAQMGNTALRDLHSSAFGDRGMDGVLAGSSPPSGPDEPLTFPKRSLHSERFAPRQMLSASLGTKLPTQSFDYSDDSEGDAEREGDLLPASLHDLIPEGRIRRESRSRIDEDSTPAGFLAAQRRTLSSHGTPQDSKVGSPHSSSPSRYSGVFMRRSTENELANAAAAAHVGSPLRNAGLTFTTASTSLPRTSLKGDLSPTISSPPRQASMSMLTQGLQRTKLDTARAASGPVGGGGNLPRSTSSNGGTTPAAGRSSLDRAFSSQSVGRERIDEEQEVFDMDEFADQQSKASLSSSLTAAAAAAVATPRSFSNGAAAASPAWNIRRLGSSPGNGEPTFGAIGGHRSGK